MHNGGTVGGFACESATALRWSFIPKLRPVPSTAGAFLF